MKFVEFHLSDRPILVNLELLESVGIDKDGKTQLAFTDLNDYFSIFAPLAIRLFLAKQTSATTAGLT